MNLMLVVMLGAVGIGVFARDFGWRQQLAIVALAIMMTTLYFFVSRFM